MKTTTAIIIIIFLLVIGGIYYRQSHHNDYSTNDNTQLVPQYQTEDVKDLVTGFGQELQQVSLLAPSDVLKQSMDEHYAKYLTPELLSSWENDHSKALGRETSNPYPARIDITSITADTEQQYTVHGKVIEVTSDQPDTAVNSYDVTIGVQDQNGRLLINTVQKG